MAPQSDPYTPEMLEIVRAEAAERGLVNVRAETADAEALPYPDARFDLVTCRIAPHHFPDVAAFVREAARVLRPGRLLAVVDNVVPEGVAGDYVNAFEKLRDPSHERCLATAEWQALFEAQGLAVLRSETSEKAMRFEAWAARHGPATRRFLKALLLEAQGEARAFLRPETHGGQTLFHLREGLFVCRRP